MNTTRTGRERGQALVEFALVFPVFLLLFFGVIDIGRLVYVNNAVAQAAREGSRWGAVADRTQANNYPMNIVDQTTGLMTAVPSPSVSIACYLPTDATLSNPVSSGLCAAGDLLQVKVSSPVQMFTPVIGQLIGTVTVASTSQVVVN